MQTIIGIIRGLLATNPARFINYGAMAVVWAVSKAGAYLGAPVPGDVELAVLTLATFILTELVRRIVYAPATVEAIRAGEQP